MVMGATDGLYLRAAGIPTYGVQGFFYDRDDIRFHGRDERVKVQSFYEGQTFLYELVKRLTGGQSSVDGGPGTPTQTRPARVDFGRLFHDSSCQDRRASGAVEAGGRSWIAYLGWWPARSRPQDAVVGCIPAGERARPKRPASGSAPVPDGRRWCGYPHPHTHRPLPGSNLIAPGPGVGLTVPLRSPKRVCTRSAGSLIQRRDCGRGLPAA